MNPLLSPYSGNTLNRPPCRLATIIKVNIPTNMNAGLKRSLSNPCRSLVSPPTSLDSFRVSLPWGSEVTEILDLLSGTRNCSTRNDSATNTADICKGILYPHLSPRYPPNRGPRLCPANILISRRLKNLALLSTLATSLK